MASNPPRPISIPELYRRFPYDATAEQWFVQQRWQGEPYCPHCGSYRVQQGAAHATMPFRCRDCRRRFSVRTGTTMQASNLGYQTWAVAIYRLTTSPKGVASTQLARELGITQKSAWHLGHRIRAAWRAADLPFDGIVEADETWIGGLEGNKHARDRWRVPKMAVLALRQRATGHIAAAIAPAVNRPTAQQFVLAHTQPDAIVLTDGSGVYSRLPRQHHVVQHSVGEIRPGRDHHEWDRILLGAFGPRLQRRLPPDERQTPGPLRGRIRGPAQRPRAGAARAHGGPGARDGRADPQLAGAGRSAGGFVSGRGSAPPCITACASCSGVAAIRRSSGGGAGFGAGGGPGSRSLAIGTLQPGRPLVQLGQLPLHHA